MWNWSGLVCCLIIVHGLSGALFLKDSLVVETKQGPVRGVHATDGDFSLFMGIPYASVDPNNTYGPPKAPPTWEEIRDVVDDNIECIQLNEFERVQTGVADCLVLNVYVPDSACLENPMPVMFYIHGGALKIGSGNRDGFGPQYFMDHDNAILVTINYRLGLHGFLCLNIEGAPGNAGLKDQVAALRWVQENIAAFGGDPKAVTIFGESAGGASVEYHVLSPMSRGLFHRAISQSCTAIAPWMTTYEPISRAKIFAAELGKVTDDVEELLNFFRTSELLDLVEATVDSATSFRPCVESKIKNVESFLTDTPLNILKSGDYEPVPYLAGFNKNEGLFYAVRNIDSAETNFESHIPDNLPYDTKEERKEKIQLIKEFYIGDQTWDEDHLYSFADLYMDGWFLAHIDKSLRLHMNKSDKVFYYELAYDGELGSTKENNMTLPGVSHGADIHYLFVQGPERYEVSSSDQLIIDRLTTMWTNFAKYGNPTPEVTDLLPITWEPATVDSIKYLYIDTEMTIKQKPYHERVAFWNMIYLNEP